MKISRCQIIIIRIQYFILCNEYYIFKMDMTIFDEFDRFFGRALAPSTQPIWCGYEMVVGPDGRPFVRRFGDVPRQTNGVRPIQVETITDSKKNEVKLVAEIPGVDKKDIRVSLNDDRAIIEATRGENKYEARVPIRRDVNPSNVKASYKNGILEVTFRLDNGPKGTVVQVD